MKQATAAVACVLCLGVFGCQEGPPPTKVEYKTQHQLLNKAMTRLESSPQEKDAETLALLRKLETELAEAEKRHLAAQREIARLQEEVKVLRHDAGFSVSLLFGVSGSGKTEVYVRAMRRVIGAGRQAILLVPEIVLTTQLVQRLAGTQLQYQIAGRTLRPARRCVVVHRHLVLRATMDASARLRAT